MSKQKGRVCTTFLFQNYAYISCGSSRLSLIFCCSFTAGLANVTHASAVQSSRMRFVIYVPYIVLISCLFCIRVREGA